MTYNRIIFPSKYLVILFSLGVPKACHIIILYFCDGPQQCERGNSVIRPMCLDCSAWKLSSIWKRALLWFNIPRVTASLKIHLELPLRRNRKASLYFPLLQPFLLPVTKIAQNSAEDSSINHFTYCSPLTSGACASAIIELLAWPHVL